MNGDVRYNAGLTLPTVALTAAPAAATHYQPVTLNAAVTSSNSATPTGFVNFDDGSTLLATIAVGSNGAASYTTPALAPGAHSITAQYSGDSNFYAASSSVVTVSVSPQAATITGLTASATAVKKGTPVKFTAVVTADGGGIPTGLVTFRDGSASLGTVKLDATGTASLTKNLSPGSHSVSVVYSGDNSNNGSTSATVVVTVSR
jgi:hypothetical protein